MAAADEDMTPPESPPSAAKGQKKSTMNTSGAVSKAAGSTSRGRKRSRRDDDEDKQEVQIDGNGGNKFPESDGRKRKARKTAHGNGGEAKKTSAQRSAPVAATRARARGPARRKNAAPTLPVPAKAAPAQTKQPKPRAGVNKGSRKPERTPNAISGAAAFRAKAAAASAAASAAGAESPRVTPKKKRATKTSVSGGPSPSIRGSSTSNGISSPFTAATKSVSDILDNPASVRKWLKILFFVTLIEAVILTANIYIGAHMENKAIGNATSTQALYTEDHRVCGRVKVDSTGDKQSDFITFASSKHARVYNDDAEEETGGGDNGGVDIVHCGQCGKCSTTNDMTILAQTTETLTDTARGCSVRAFLGSIFLLRGIGTYRSISQRCMEDKVGFTPPCLDCWLDNMVCGVQKCVFTCLKSQYIDWDPKNHADGKINRCYECDEKLCGPAFLQCSGTNRRRQGIRSDLSRDDDKELCQAVDVDWNSYADGGEKRRATR